MYAIIKYLVLSHIIIIFLPIAAFNQLNLFQMVRPEKSLLQTVIKSAQETKEIKINIFFITCLRKFDQFPQKVGC